MFILQQKREGDFHKEITVISFFCLEPKWAVNSIIFSVFDLKNGPFPIQISCETARFWVNAIRVPYPA
jgi:hypothetical protein